MTGGFYCCAYGCGTNTKRHKGKSYFRLPTDPEKLALWLSLIRREDLLEKSKSGRLNQRVCCDHFKEEDFAYIKTLNENAVPRLHFDSQERQEPEASTSSSSLNTAECKEISTQTNKHESMNFQSQTNEEQRNINEESKNVTKPQYPANPAIAQKPRSLTPRKRKLTTDLSKAKIKIKLEKKEN